MIVQVATPKAGCLVVGAGGLSKASSRGIDEASREHGFVIPVAAVIYISAKKPNGCWGTVPAVLLAKQAELPGLLDTPQCDSAIRATAAKILWLMAAMCVNAANIDDSDPPDPRPLRSISWVRGFL
ncbi:hypothetical protein [Actinomadura spongiicola]|uniref:hypothetical protein n=1 Tax=Actinomadura spongiicola TaxID=2303421 RepID=UPI0011C0D342|nr:hypothetical protein [Actinomadura spongiicola]